MSWEANAGYVEVRLLELERNSVGAKKQYENIAGNFLAHAVQQSIALGFDGYVLLIAKTALVAHYVNAYGASVIGGNRLVFDRQAANNLILRYG